MSDRYLLSQNNDEKLISLQRNSSQPRRTKVFNKYSSDLEGSGFDSEVSIGAPKQLKNNFQALKR